MLTKTTPQKSECPAATGQTQAEISAHTEILLDADQERKAYSTLAVRLALKGYALHDLSCGGFLVSRWDRTAHFSDLSGVRQFLQRIGGDA